MNNCAALIARRLGVVCRPNRVQALSRFSSSAPQHSAASDALRSTADASNASNTSTAASAPASFVGHVFQRRGDATNAAQDASHSAKGEAPMSTREAEEEERSMTALHKARIAHAAERNRMVEGLPVGNESLGSYSKNMGGLAVDPSLRDPWQRALQIGTALVTVLLAYSMVTVAPQYQRDPSQVNKAAAESFRQWAKGETSAKATVDLAKQAASAAIGK